MSSPIVLDEFQLVRPEDVEEVLGSVRMMAYALEPLIGVQA